MDVRFCEGRNHCREAHVRAAGSDKVRRARSSEARLRRIFFSLTKTYMDVGNSEVMTLEEARAPLLFYGPVIISGRSKTAFGPCRSFSVSYKRIARTHGTRLPILNSRDLDLTALLPITS